MLGRVGKLLGVGPQQKPNPVRAAAIRHVTGKKREELKGNFRTLAEQIVNSPSSVGLAGLVIASLFGKASASVNTTAAINEAVNCLESDGNCTAKVNTLHQLFQNFSLQGAQDLATIQGLNAQVELLSGANAACFNTTQQLQGVLNETQAQIEILEANATQCSVELFEAREFSNRLQANITALEANHAKVVANLVELGQNNTQCQELLKNATSDGQICLGQLNNTAASVERLSAEVKDWEALDEARNLALDNDMLIKTGPDVNAAVREVQGCVERFLQIMPGQCNPSPDQFGITEPVLPPIEPFCSNATFGNLTSLLPRHRVIETLDAINVDIPFALINGTTPVRLTNEEIKAIGDGFNATTQESRDVASDNAYYRAQLYQIGGAICTGGFTQMAEKLSALPDQMTAPRLLAGAGTVTQTVTEILNCNTTQAGNNDTITETEVYPGGLSDEALWGIAAGAMVVSGFLGAVITWRCMRNGQKSDAQEPASDLTGGGATSPVRQNQGGGRQSSCTLDVELGSVVNDEGHSQDRRNDEL